MMDDGYTKSDVYHCLRKYGCFCLPTAEVRWAPTHTPYGVWVIKTWNHLGANTEVAADKYGAISALWKKFSAEDGLIHVPPPVFTEAGFSVYTPNAGVELWYRRIGSVSDFEGGYCPFDEIQFIEDGSWHFIACPVSYGCSVGYGYYKVV